MKMTVEVLTIDNFSTVAEVKSHYLALLEGVTSVDPEIGNLIGAASQPGLFDNVLPEDFLPRLKEVSYQIATSKPSLISRIDKSYPRLVYAFRTEELETRELLVNLTSWMIDFSLMIVQLYDGRSHTKPSCLDSESVSLISTSISQSKIESLQVHDGIKSLDMDAHQTILYLSTGKESILPSTLLEHPSNITRVLYQLEELPEKAFWKVMASDNFQGLDRTDWNFIKLCFGSVFSLPWSLSKLNSVDS